jgi:rhodanese-related sulfurtransferase
MFVAMVALAATTICVVRIQQGRMMAKGTSADLRDLARLVVASVAFSLAWHAFTPEGFLLNRSAVASLVATFHSAFVPHLSLEELRVLLQENAVTVIDARRPEDHRRGHITGAISVPVTASTAERERALAHVSRSSRIVVYCQNERCPWAGDVVNVLSAYGYTNLSVFPGGWHEWSKTVHKSRDGK